MSSSGRHRNWLKYVSISEPSRPGGLQGGGHRWSTKQMLLSRRCCPMWFQWRPLSCWPGVFPWWCFSVIYVRPQPWLLNRMRASPLYLDPGSLCLNLRLHSISDTRRNISIQLVKATINKSGMGDAADVICCLPPSASLDDIIEKFQWLYVSVESFNILMQEFYQII